jgi:hypothetical protein
MNREDAIKAITDGGKTREQAEAFLDILGSAFARRGWVEGEPLGPDAIAERLDTFVTPPTT